MKKTLLIAANLLLCIGLNAQWTKSTPPGLPQRMLVDGSTIYIGAYASVIKSTDNGQNWTVVDSGIVSNLSNCTGLIKVGNRLVASYGGNGNHYVYYSENDGETWQLDTANWAPPIINNIRPYSVHTLNYKNTHTICVLESNYILYKSNTDNQWSNLNPPSTHRTPNAIHFDGDTIFLFRLRTIDNTCDIAYTTDLGANWDTLPVTSNINVRGVPFKNAQNGTLHVGLGTASRPFDEIIWSSNDNGRTWDTSRVRNLNTRDRLVGLWTDDDLMIAAFQTTNSDTLNKIMMSEDGGTTWTDMTGDLVSQFQFKFHPMSNLSVINNRIWVFQGSSIYTLALDGSNPTSISEINPHSSNRISIFPNPAHTKISVNGACALIQIYDINGRLLIATEQTETIDISSLNNGVYIVKTRDNSNVESIQKLIKN